METSVIILGKYLNYYDSFIEYIKCIPKFTYVKKFPKIQKSNFTSDIGWGCTIRSCQMMLNYGYILHYDLLKNINNDKKKINDMIKNTFVDNYTGKLSVHSICFFGEKINKLPGDWYGPNTISYIMNMIFNFYDKIMGISLYCVQNMEIDEHKILSLLNKNPLFMLIPMKFSNQKKMNNEYLNLLKNIISLPYTLGFIGGKNNSSFYIIGFDYIQNQWIYFDPHKIKEYQSEFDFRNDYKKMDYHCIDPNISIGFYIKDKKSFLNFQLQLKELSSIFVFSKKQKCKYNNVKNEEDWNIIC